jgi:hypothetical protein
MKRNLTHTLAAGVAALVIVWSPAASAHCDTLDGPVVTSARKALETGDPNPALVWVQKGDEPEIRKALREAVAVRKVGGEAKALADRYFFETLVRVHRAGEGAPYTGLKPAGKPEPAVAAADKSIDIGQLEPVGKLVTGRVHEGLDKRFNDVKAKKNFKPNDVAAGRAYVSAYVDYVHYVERLHEAASAGAAHDAQKAPVHAH